MPTIPPKFGKSSSHKLPFSLALFVTAFVFLCAQTAYAATIYVSPSGSNANSGSDWSQAKQSVQSGINASVAGDQVWVAQGTYTELVTLKKSVAVYGGFAGTETDLSQRNFQTHATILDGGQLGSVVISPSDSAIGPDTLIDGFTIRNGKAQNGGGFFSSAGSPTVMENVFVGNTAMGNGGGIYCLNGSPNLTANTLKGNTAPNGGGIYFASSGAITANKIVGNLGLSGVGIYVNGGIASIKNNILYGNVTSANGSGGGIALNSNFSVTLANNLLDSNFAAVGGGLILGTGQALIANNTFVNNRDISPYGGAIYIGASAANTTLASNIIAYNSSGLGQYVGVMASLSHNDVYANFATPGTAPQNYAGISAGATDLSVNPLFVDFSGGNNRLMMGSPLIDAGDDSYSNLSLVDLDGNVRLNGSHIDVGAYESSTPNASITLTSLSPASSVIAPPGAPALTLTLNGVGFVSGAVATWNGILLPTTFVNATQLTAQVSSDLLSTIDLATVAVVSLNGSATNALSFSVVNPVPIVSDISPASGFAGGSDFTITVNGSRFTPTSLIRWTYGGGVYDLTTTYVSPTQLMATVSASLFSSVGYVGVSVFNQMPGGGTSNAALYRLSNPVPSISSLTPNSVYSGSGDTALTVNGTGFIRSSVITWNGQALATTFVSGTQLTTVLAASILSVAATNNITVTNPTPGGGASNTAVFTVNQSHVPVLTSISPSSVLVGSPNVTLTATGSDFLPNSTIQFYGAYPPPTLSTTYVSPTQLTTVIPASALTIAAYDSISVVTPGPGGGISAPLQFLVKNPVATITSTVPASALAGGAGFTLTVNGTGFVTLGASPNYPYPTSTVLWNGTRLTTTYVSPTQLTAVVPAANIASPGVASIAVTNSAPGGGTSNAVSFPIVSSSFALSSNSVYNTNTVTGTLTLATPATATAIPFAGLPPGAYAQITSSNSAATFTPGPNLVIAPNGATYVYIPIGQTSATFTIATGIVTSPISATISVAYGGGTTTSNLAITPTLINSLTVIPSILSSGALGTATLTLNGPAVAGAIPAGLSTPGTYVALNTTTYVTVLSGPTIVRSVTGQPLLFLAPGQTSATFKVAPGFPSTTTSGSVTGTLNSSTATASITVSVSDPNAPTTTATLSGIQGGNGWFRGPVQVTLTATDPNGAADIAATYYVLDGGAQQTYTSPFTISSDSVHVLYFWSVDQSAHKEATRSRVVSIDSVNPTIVFGTPTPSANAAGWNNTAVDVPYTATDATSGLASATPGSPAHITSQGTYQALSITARDVAGNTAIGFTPQVNIDLTAPVTTGSINGSQVTLSATDALSGIKSKFYTVDGGAQQTYSAPFTVSTVGAHTIRYWSVDVADNTETAKTLTFNNDTTPPTTTLSFSGTLGSNGWYLMSGQVTLTATDPEGASDVAATYYTLDGGAQQTYATPFIISGNGVHTITFFSVDKAGNTEATQTKTIKIDTLSPGIAFGVPAPAANALGWNNTLVDVPYTTSDTTSGVASATPGSPVHFASAGLHQVQTVTVTDNAGNGVSGVTPQINIDLTAPVSSESHNGSQITLGATDALSGVKSINYTIDGGAVQTYTVPFPVSGEGTHTVLYWSTDNADNVEAAKTLPLTNDMTAPTTTASLSGTQGSNGWYTSAVQVTLTATDSLSGVAATYYTIDGGAQQTYSVPFAVSGDAVHSITFLSVDGVSNRETPQTVSIKIDGTAPVTTGSASNGQVTLLPTDNLSGVASTYYTIDGGAQQTYSVPFAVSVGTHTVQYGSVDIAGNIETAQSLSVTFNAVPTLTSLTPSSANAGSSAFTLTVSGTGFVNGSVIQWNGQALETNFISGTSLTASISASLIASPGTASVTVTTPAPGGGTSNALSFTIVDVTPPSTTITLSGTEGSNIWTGSTAFNGWYRSAVQVTLTATSGNANAATITTYYTLDSGTQQTYAGPFTVSGDGTHTVTFWSVDQAGNAEGTKSQSVKIDTTNPVVTFGLLSPAPNANGWNNTPVTISYTAIDATSGIGFDNAPKPLPFNFEGAETWDLQVFDVAGNDLFIESPTVYSDYTAPTTTASVSGAQVTLTAVDQVYLSGVAHTYYTIDSGAQQTYASPITIGEGGHVVHYWSVDNADNIESPKSVNVSVDTTPPVTTATPSGTLGANGWYRSSVQVTLLGTDTGTGVAATYYKLDGGTQQTYSSALMVTTAGSHNVQYWSVDNAGNTEAVKSLAVKIDGTAPVTTGSVSGAQVTLSATDSTSGVAATYYTIDSGTQQTYSSAITVGQGTHLVSYWSVDNAGNVEAAKSVSVSVDTTPPTTSASPSGTLGSNGWYTSAVSILLSGTDTGSGVAATYYKLDGGAQQTYSSAIAISSAGTHTLQYWSVDNAGNTESAKLLSVKIDGTAPVTTGSVSGAQVTLAATDSTSGVAATYYTIDGGTQQTYASPFTVTGAGSHTISYRSVDNAGNSETAKTLSVTVNAVPTITTLSPSSVTAGSAAFTLTVTGTGFVSGSTIQWNGAALTTTYVSATSLTASVSASLVATAGTASVMVTTPAPGGGTSNASTFTITAVSSPVTVTPAVASNSGYFGQENITINNTQAITALTVTIVVQRTAGVAYSGQYTNYAGSSMTMTNSSNGSQITYTYALKSSKTVSAGSGWLTAAQFSGTGSVHPTTGDTYSVTCTAGGVVRTFSGHF